MSSQKKYSKKQYASEAVPVRSRTRVTTVAPRTVPKQRYQYQRATYSRPYATRAGQAAGAAMAAHLNPALVPLGMGVGGQLGGAAADLFKTLTGFGDYAVKQNVLSPGAPPSVRNRKVNDGGVVISHREYLGDIVSSSSANTFKLQAFPINPGSAITFPWLSQVASNFQEYRMEGLVFEFRSMSADALNSTNTALGSVILATNYNASDENFSSKSEMENSQFGQSVKPSDSCLHLIECARSSSVLSELYIRDGTAASNDDDRFYDLGKFQIATTGLQGTNVNLGELWVSYQVCLMKPLLEDAIGNDVLYAHFNDATGVDNDSPLGTSNSEPNPGFSLIGLNPDGTTSPRVDGTGTVLFVPQFSVKKTYLITMIWKGDSTAITFPAITFAGSNASGPLLYEGEAVAVSGAPPSGGTTTILMRQWCRSWEGYSNTANSMTFATNGTFPANITTFDIIISEIPNDPS